MKLQTKIVCISCVAVIMAMLLSDAVIWNIYKNAYYNEIKQDAYHRFYEKANSFEKGRDISQLRYDDIEVLRYIAKMIQDDYFICFYVEGESKLETIFNHTNLTYEDLVDLNYSYYKGFRYAWYDNGNQKYMILEINIGMLRCYYVEDIEYARHNMFLLAIALAVSSIIITSLVMFILYVVIKRSFMPLSELSMSAKAIAAGQYDKRIVIKQNDEVGELADNFNQMADAVEEHTKSIEESEYKKTLFMGNLTHELKTPMTVISGYAQTLLMAKLEPEDEMEALEFIYKECGRLERLSQKMMKLLELDQNTDIDIKEHKVKEVFDAAHLACSVLLREHDIILDIEEHGESFNVDIDLMTDVVINLVDNAIKASEKGSHILLDAGIDDNDQTYIRVKDSGRGIPEEFIDKIMEPFYMVDKSRSRKGGGAGLGLALSKLILEHHDMYMDVKSMYGVGTEITIYKLFTK